MWEAGVRPEAPQSAPHAADLPMRQISDAKSFAEAARWSIAAKRVTFRTYGVNNEQRRPMMHRFEVKGGVSIASVMADNLTTASTLLKRLKARGK